MVMDMGNIRKLCGWAAYLDIRFSSTIKNLFIRGNNNTYINDGFSLLILIDIQIKEGTL